jgi:hypothetical protein
MAYAFVEMEIVQLIGMSGTRLVYSVSIHRSLNVELNRRVRQIPIV